MIFRTRLIYLLLLLLLLYPTLLYLLLVSVWYLCF